MYIDANLPALEDRAGSLELLSRDGRYRGLEGEALTNREERR
jgi:hypothetical protein